MKAKIHLKPFFGATATKTVQYDELRQPTVYYYAQGFYLKCGERKRFNIHGKHVGYDILYRQVRGERLKRRSTSATDTGENNEKQK